jgi:hypothetical protein
MALSVRPASPYCSVLEGGSFVIILTVIKRSSDIAQRLATI